MQGVYRHYKGGLYTVLMSAQCSDNGPNEGENVVVYVSHTTGSVRTRLAKEFFGKVSTYNGGEVTVENAGRTVDRFSFVAHALGK